MLSSYSDIEMQMGHKYLNIKPQRVQTRSRPNWSEQEKFFSFVRSKQYSEAIELAERLKQLGRCSNSVSTFAIYIKSNLLNFKEQQQSSEQQSSQQESSVEEEEENENEQSQQQKQGKKQQGIQRKIEVSYHKEIIHKQSQQQKNTLPYNANNSQQKQNHNHNHNQKQKQMLKQKQKQMQKKIQSESILKLSNQNLELKNNIHSSDDRKLKEKQVKVQINDISLQASYIRQMNKNVLGEEKKKENDKNGKENLFVIKKVKKPLEKITVTQKTQQYLFKNKLGKPGKDLEKPLPKLTNLSQKSLKLNAWELNYSSIPAFPTKNIINLSKLR